MIRRIIRIDPEKCNGCGACAAACHEGAIQIIGGKAKLTSEHYCDGLGACLPVCPANAISFEDREAPAYDAAAVAEAKAAAIQQNHTDVLPGLLSNWPIQLKLVPPVAPVFSGADLLIAADCTAYAYGNFHADFIRGKTTVIACPKLDAIDYSEKLALLFSSHAVRSVTLTRMEVPCCGGLEYAIRRAMESAGKQIPLRVVTISPDGTILEDAAVN